MTNSATADLLSILQDCFNPREDGWLWVAVLPAEGSHGVVQQIEGDYEDPVPTADALAAIISGCGADRAFLALCRRDARPTEGDCILWRRLREAVRGELLIDMVVFNRHRTWSMRADDSAVA